MSTQDRHTVGAIFNEHRESLVRYARTLVDHATADDVVSEAFLRLLRYETARHRELTRQYLFRVVRNIVNREHRRLGTAPQRNTAEADEPLSSLGTRSAAEALEPLDDAESPQSRALMASLARVRDDDFHTLVLTSVRGLSSQQAGSALELKPQVVCRRRSSVLKHLRSLLASA